MPATAMHADSIRIAHVIHHLQVGGLENGLINLINRLPADRYHHAIVCVDDYSEAQLGRIAPDVDIYALRKPPGKSVKILRDFYRLFRKIQPDIVHSRNIAGLDSLLPGFLAGVPARIHGEHGRDMNDLVGANKKLIWLRRLHKPFIHRYIPLSQNLQEYLEIDIGIAKQKITQIYNGVDLATYQPKSAEERTQVPEAFRDPQLHLIGTVGRQQPVKNPLLLVEGFHVAREENPDFATRLRLVMIGDGPEAAAVQRRVAELGLQDACWLAGERHDAAALLPELDVFVLPSRAEGISNTILEAMASGLPVIATNVGGNPELVANQETGFLIQSDNAQQLAKRLGTYIRSPDVRRAHAEKGLARVKRKFSLENMVSQYDAVYQSHAAMRKQPGRRA